MEDDTPGFSPFDCLILTVVYAFVVMGGHGWRKLCGLQQPAHSARFSDDATACMLIGIGVALYAVCRFVDWTSWHWVWKTIVFPAIAIGWICVAAGAYGLAKNDRAR